MDLSLQFLGAAKNVTGSCTLIRAGSLHLLVDCGLYQERDFKPRNWESFPVPPKQIDAVLLTHAHLDHCGRIPRLVKEGFRGPIFCTAATADIAAIIMQDSAKIQEEDIKHKKARHEREGRESPYPYEPLYTMEDADQAIALLSPVPHPAEDVPVADGITATFRGAGHIFGSTCIRLRIEQDGASRTLLFSGDIGRHDMPIIKDPEPFHEADIVVMESTYGNRTHTRVADLPAELARVINETHARGGNVVIPSFAVERTQELLYHLHALLREDRIPHLMTFVDSPMAIRVIDVFKKHPELFDEETMELIHQGIHPCDLPGLTLSNTVDESKAINHIRGTAVIIAGSGMCTGGRIKHHLKNNISRPESTVLFVGYQAAGTLGRVILNRPERVRIHGAEQELKAHVEQLTGFSAHADRDELLRWVTALRSPPRAVFITHGETEVATSFSEFLQDKTGWTCHVPEYMEEVAIGEG